MDVSKSVDLASHSCRYAESNSVDLMPTGGQRTFGWDPALGLSYTGTRRGPLGFKQTHFQFLPPALVRLFSPDNEANCHEGQGQGLQAVV